MSIRNIQPTQIIKVTGQDASPESPDLLAAEEPLEIRLSYGKGLARKQKSISVTMRTPGQDFELAVGFLFTEGLIAGFDDIESIRYCTEWKDPAEKDNIVLIYLKPGITLNEKLLERHFYTTSSCGVCGKSSIEAIENQNCSIQYPKQDFVSVNVIHGLAKASREAQIVFRHTGGIHAASLFDTQGKLLLQREDIGRHNAVDKVIGACLIQHDISLENTLLLVSGRAGFELVQKTVVAGIPLMAAIGAPSSLAVDLARRFKITLLGFVRNDQFNIYASPERIEMGTGAV